MFFLPANAFAECHTRMRTRKKSIQDTRSGSEVKPLVRNDALFMKLGIFLMNSKYGA